MVWLSALQASTSSEAISSSSVFPYTSIEALPRWLLDGLNVNFYFGGTSLLIVVGVAMDTVNQIEAQLVMRHYEGFTPRAGRIRGRRSRG